MRAKSQFLSSFIILKVAVNLPINRLFDYLVPPDVQVNKLAPGLRLEIPFGNRIKIGYLIEISQNSDVDISKLKTISKVLDDKPLISPADMKLLSWASGYYHHPLGEVVSNAFPLSLRKVNKASEKNTDSCYRLTALGKTASVEQLKRSPRQQQLLQVFQQSVSHTLGESELNQTGIHWRPVLKALLAKQFVQITDRLEQKSISAHVNNATQLDNPICLTAKPLPLNKAQQIAVDAVTSALHQFKAFLLEGVTGSGKTEVYMQIIHLVIASGKQVLVLVPEISLTPQLQSRFQERFSISMAVSHSGLTDKQRHTAWVSMQQGSSAIMLGTRSALFTPLKNPGLIILDEEHDSSFKQQEGFRYSARDVAIMRAKLLNIPVLLGSATPSLESLFNVEQKRYQHLVLSERAGNAVAPSLHLLDIRNKKIQHGLCEALLCEIRKVLINNEQVLIFVNRRGYAPTLICHSCAWMARCNHCDANLVIHSHTKLLRCHHCGREQRLPSTCPACHSADLMPLGIGTERIENALNELFPEKTLVRLDRDTTQYKGALERYLNQINDGTADIILGTQMLAKGHHFPNVTLAAIVDVDSGLFSVDFRSAERLAQLITQVSGRAGRADKPGRVILQTRYPEHPILNTLIHDGYNQFARIALQERKQANLPPFSHYSLIRSQAGKADMSLAFLTEVANFARNEQTKEVSIVGPVAAPMTKRAGVYRHQLLLQGSSRKSLQTLLTKLVNHFDKIKTAKTIRWSLDIDPIDLF